MNDRGIAFEIGSLTVRWYGILIALAFALGSYLAYRETQRQKLSVDDLLNILLILIPSAIVGARLYYVIMRWDYYMQYPELILKTWTGGLAIHGGVIAAALAILLYCHKRKLSFLRWADILSPALILGQAIGRWGNYINQEAYGYETTVPWAILIDGVYRHPAFLYESLWDLLVFFLLAWLIRRHHRVGSVFASYLIFYSIGRFFIEMVRTDSLMLGPFRVAMLVSGLGVLLGTGILYQIRKQPMVDVTALPEHKGGSRQQQRAKERQGSKKKGKKA